MERGAPARDGSTLLPAQREGGAREGCGRRDVTFVLCDTTVEVLWVTALHADFLCRWLIISSFTFLGLFCDWVVALRHKCDVFQRDRLL